MAEPIFDYSWVRTSAELEAVSKELALIPLISVDTETWGWNTGNEKLCLVQVGIPDTKKVYLIDALAIDDFSSFGKVLSAEFPLIVAHNAAFEERQFARYDIKIRGIRDTLKMARELRPDLPNYTLRTCCKILLGIELNKTEQTSDWSARPLTEAQIHYARLDAEVALILYDYLADLEHEIQEGLELPISELMREYSLMLTRKNDLMRGISHEVAFIDAKRERIYNAIRQRMIAGEEAYDGEYGYCRIQKIKKNEVNVGKLRELYPEIAHEVIREYVDRKQFEIVAKERGLPKNSIQGLLEVVGYNERMALKLRDDAGELDESGE